MTVCANFSFLSSTGFVSMVFMSFGLFPILTVAAVSGRKCSAKVVKNKEKSADNR